MAYDEKLADRIGAVLSARAGISERLMFGGVCYMLNGNMCCGIVKDKLMLRVGPDNYEAALKKKGATIMEFTGRPMTGMIYVLPEGMKTEKALARWIDWALEFVGTMPPKVPKVRPRRKFPGGFVAPT